MTDRVWICFVAAEEEFGPRIRAWTDDQQRAERFRAEGLDMVEFVRLAAAGEETEANGPAALTELTRET